jgi:TRAP-type mannitol/chloroaromatic compound transport system permease small subunit
VYANTAVFYQYQGLQNDTHVRVDVFYLNFSPKTQALINIIGSVVFILPISLLITYYGLAAGWWL